MTFSVVPTPGEYVPDLQQWQPLHNLEVVQLNITRLTVATLNVWFAADYFAERCRATLALLATHQPDVITLQEVTPPFLDQVLQTPWIQAEYRVSDMYGDSIDPYGVLILSRLPLADWQAVPLPSAMGRHLICARAALNGATTTCASVHLESRSYTAPTRAKQLARIFPLLATAPHAILTGDFNFCSTWDENQCLDPTYQDIWPVLHPMEPGFTVDTGRNTMRLRSAEQQKQGRFDRILLRSKHPGWHAKSIQYIGTEPIHRTSSHPTISVWLAGSSGTHNVLADKLLTDNHVQPPSLCGRRSCHLEVVVQVKLKQTHAALTFAV